MRVDHGHRQASGTLYRRTQLSPAGRASTSTCTLTTNATTTIAWSRPRTPPPPSPPTTSSSLSWPRHGPAKPPHSPQQQRQPPPLSPHQSSSSSSSPLSSPHPPHKRHHHHNHNHHNPQGPTTGDTMLRLPLLFRIPNKLRRRARRNRIMALAMLLLLLLLPVIICLYVVYRPPALVVRYMMSRFPDVLWHVDTAKKVVALTIDDAPSQHTAEILSVLRENQAHATFFVIGSQAQGQAREDALRDAVLGGNELGNHAWRDEGSATLGDEQLRAEIAGVKAIIRQTYAAEGELPPPNYFRPGGGFFSARMRALVDKLGYRIVLGDVYPHDPQMPWPGLNSWHILSMVRPGSIIICHDRRSWTVPMLKMVLPELRRRGYEVVTISRLLEEVATDDQNKRGL